MVLIPFQWPNVLKCYLGINLLVYSEITVRVHDEVGSVDPTFLQQVPFLFMCFSVSELSEWIGFIGILQRKLPCLSLKWAILPPKTVA